LVIVNTELIVYGRTETDARVTVQGKEIKVGGTATFSSASPCRMAKGYPGERPFSRRLTTVHYHHSDQETI
jgi:hypothetical protein